MTSQPLLAQLQQENDRLRAELSELRSRYEAAQQSEAQNRQTSLLSTIAQVASLLLRSSDYIAVLPDVVQMLGEAVGSDRCAITQDVIHPSLGKPAVKVLIEWCQGNIIDSIQATPELESALEWENLPEFREKFLRGESANFLIEQLQAPSRQVLGGQGIASILVVPIMIGGKPWGQIGFDNCGEPRLHNEAEIAILRIAADSIAAAIERQAKDDELRRSEALYRSLFEISNEGIYRWELDQPVSIHLPLEEQVGQIYQNYYCAQANDAHAQMMGLTKGEDSVGLRLSDVHVGASQKNQDFVRGVISNGYSIRNAESEEIDASGCKRYFLNSVTSFIEDDRVTGGWGTQIDITELREAQQALLQTEQERSQELERLNVELQQTLEHEVELRYRLSESEERYRTLFEISSEGIYRFEYHPPVPLSPSVEEQAELIRQNCYIPEGNQTFVEMYGFENIGEFDGMWLRDIHVGTSEKNLLFLRTLAENGHQIRNYESEEVDLKGNPRYFLNNISTIIKDGYAIGGWASQLDITELRLAQQALLQAEQDRVAELAKTNQALKNSIDRLAADPDLNGFLGHVVLEIIQQLNLYTAWVELYDPTAQTLQMHLLIEQGTLYLQHDLPGRGYLTEGYSPQDDVCWNLLLQTRQPVIITPENLSQFFAGDDLEMQRQWGQQFGIQCGINLLLMLGDNPLGLLVLFSTERTTFGCEELELIEALAQQATLAIALTRLAEEAKHASLLQERNRIAQDIHDTLAQTFGGILIQLQATQYFVKRNPDRAVEQFNTALTLAREGLAEARRSVWTLYDQSADYQSLETALPQLVERLTANSTTRVIATITGTSYRIDPEIGQNLLRLAQEAINNALRHAHAQTIRLTLAYERDRLSLSIQDDGRGFDPSQPISGFGISSMKQRAEYLGGTLSLTSQPGMGTEVAIVVSTVVPNSQPANLAQYVPREGASKPQ